MLSRKYLSISFLFLFTIDCIFCFKANAESRFSMAETVKKRIVIEHVYLFYVMQYDPPVPADAKTMKSIPETFKYIFGPEKTAIAYLTAQVQGDYEWYYSLLSKPLQQKIDDELAMTGKTPAELAKGWQKKFQNKKVELTHRIERGSYSIIRYHIVSPSDGAVIEKNHIAFRQSEGDWGIVDLTGDPVFESWDFVGTEKRIQKK